MISPEQIRAARALLNWSQAELAARSGLSKAALVKLEGHLVTPRVSSLNFIQETFEAAGIEFTEGDGIKKRTERFNFQIYEGSNFVDHLDVNAVKHLQPKDTLYGIGGYDKNFGEFNSKKNNDTFLKHVIKNQVDCRLIAPDGFTDFGCDPKGYRFLPEESIGTIYFTVYQDILTIINWGKPPRAIFIRNQSIADTYKKQFEFLWRMAKKPDPVLLPIWRQTWKERNKHLFAKN